MPKFYSPHKELTRVMERAAAPVQPRPAMPSDADFEAVKRDHCPAWNSGGVHSDSYGDDGDGECALCGVSPKGSEGRYGAESNIVPNSHEDHSTFPDIHKACPTIGSGGVHNLSFEEHGVGCVNCGAVPDCDDCLDWDESTDDECPFCGKVYGNPQITIDEEWNEFAKEL